MYAFRNPKFLYYLKPIMSEHGAALQTYNQELVKCLEELKSKKNKLEDIIYREEAERVVLEKNLKALQEKLCVLNQRLDHHKETYDQYENTIKDTENGFKKILESSQTLLQVVQHETSRLDYSHNNNYSPTPKEFINSCNY